MSPEIATIVAKLNEMWTEIRQTVQEVDSDTLTFKPGQGFNSISTIITHVAGSQKWWIGEVLAGRDMQRDRDAEFRAVDDDPSVLIGRLDDSATLVREILETVTSEMLDQTRLYRGEPVTVRWILTRVLTHTALHVGHIQITRQLWALQQGQKGN